jgi:hypothetical protein
MLKTRVLAVVARPYGWIVTLAVALGVISLAYGGLEWWQGDATAWKNLAGTGASLMLLASSLLHASLGKTMRVVLLITTCVLVVLFYSGIVVSFNHRNAGTPPPAVVGPSP